MTTSHLAASNSTQDTSAAERRTRRVLDPIDRTSEILFALIMVLAITCSYSVAESGREDVHAMLIGAIGCNVAWGIVDAVMYLMAGLTERACGRRLLRELRDADDPARARRIISDALPPLASSALEPGALEAIRLRLIDADVPKHRWVGRKDLIGAIAVFLWVFLTTIPVVIPFVFMHDAARALRVSNAIAIAMLYVIGHLLGRYAGVCPWLIGLIMVALGISLVAATIALGG